MKTSERLLRTCIFREIAKVPKVQFLSPKVQFFLLTIWKFQKFFVSLQRKRKGIFLSFNAASQRFKGLRPFKSSRAAFKRVPNLIQARRIQVQRRFCFQNDRSGCRIRPRLAPNCASWLTLNLTLTQSPSPCYGFHPFGGIRGGLQKSYGNQVQTLSRQPR